MTERVLWGVVGLLCVPLLWLILGHRNDPFRLTLLRAHRGNIQSVERAAKESLPEITKETRFQNRWAINPVTSSAHNLHVELFRSDLETGVDRTTMRYTNNCSYVGHENLIICDVRVFETLMHRWGLDRKGDTGGRDWPDDVEVPVVAKSPAEQADDLRALVTWVLGHELGHVLNGDSGQFADTIGLLSIAPSTRMTQRRELAADEVLLHRTYLQSPERKHLIGFVTDALNTELQLKYCPDRDVMQRCPGLPLGVGIIYDYTSDKPLAVDSSMSHPEFIVRLVRLSQLHHIEVGCDKDPFCEMLERVVERLKAR